MTPAGALAHDLIARGYRVAVITDPRGLKYMTLFPDVTSHIVQSGAFKPGLKSKMKGMIDLGLGAAQALRLLRRQRPALVVGFGGYPSVPAVYMAQRLGIPTILHEQNAIIGKANAFLAAKAKRIALSMPEVQGLDREESRKCVVTGNPVRPNIAALYVMPYPMIDQSGVLRLFIMGGSLGAKVFSTIVPEALSNLHADYRLRLHVVQQCRLEDIDHVRALYEAAGIRADLAPFFDDVPGELARAHLVISRSGASTVAEVTSAGRPAIFVPYPHHKDQQQKMNADVVADQGGAWVMTENGFSAQALLARIETFLQNPSILSGAAEKSRLCAHPDAALKLGNVVAALLNGGEG